MFSERTAERIISDGNAGFADDESCQEWSWRKSKQRSAGSRRIGYKDPSIDRARFLLPL
jgi:hypothetical protein